MINLFALQGTDTGLSDEARALFHDRLRGHIESPSMASLDLGRALREVSTAAEQATEDDWDGEGGARVEQSTVRHAVNFLRRLNYGFPVPTVTVDREGDFVFDWERGKEFFSVSVGRDGGTTFAGLSPDGPTHGRRRPTAAIPPEILVGIHRVASARMA